MAELFLQISVSLDGFIEDGNGDIEWMTGDTSFDAFATATLQSIDGMILGRKAHALLATFWPTAGDVPRLKREATRAIALFAGARAAQALLERAVVDEIRLIQYPILLGRTPLFAESDTRRSLRLIASERFESGATLNRYRTL
jgi:dihydrofolate reductase